MTLHPPMSDAELWAEAERRLASAGQPRKPASAPAKPVALPTGERGTSTAKRAATKRQKATVPAEHDEQVAFFDWCEAMAPTVPDLGECFAVPNFSGRLGKAPPIAAIRQAEKLNREGRKKGVEDVMLLIARGGFHGLLMEFKRQNATPSDMSPEQRAWHAIHRGRGFHVVVCKGCEEAKAVVLAYLAMPETITLSPVEALADAA